MLQCAKNAWYRDGKWAEGKKYLQVSTDEVYGSLGETGYFMETTPLDPHSPYSASKTSADLFVKAFGDTYGMPVNITRCSNNYGPYQFPEKLIPLMINNAKTKKGLPVYGDGMNVRDWLYVEDHCKAIDMVASGGRVGEVYNVGGHNERPNIFIVKKIIEILHDKVDPSIDESLIKYVEDRMGHDRRYGIDPEKIDLVTIAEYGEHGVLALLSDSTNAERPGFTATEQKVGASMEALFSRAGKKRIIIATFASNLYRVQQLIDLAVKAGRKVAVSGRSMVNNTQMALELGYLHAPETVLIDIEDINKYPPEKIVLITTGSQGEPLSALSRMAAASHRNVRVGEGDFIIISANPIPGNEKMVTKVVNGLLKLGAEVIYESMYDVHVSGHACQEEQKLMLTLAKPQFFLPVHGEYKHLKKHAQTAAAVGIPEKNIYIGENGDCVVLSADGLTVGEPVPAGAVMVDGLGVGDVGNVVLRDRRHLSEDGLVIVVATIDARTGEVLAGPDLVSRGFVYVRESEKLLDDARDQVRDVLGRMSAADKRDFGSVKTRIRETVSAFLYRKTKRSPMILPILMEV